MRIKQNFNDNWFYIDNFEEEYVHKHSGVEGFTPVRLPHANREVPYNYFDERDYQFMSCYKKNFKIGKDAKDKVILIEFEGVMAACEVYINGKFVEEHRGGYVPFKLNITPYITYDDDNTIVVKVDSREREDIPPFGNVIDYLTFGGIYRDAYLYILEPTYIDNVFYAYELQDRNATLRPILYTTSDVNKDLDVCVELGDKKFEWEIDIEAGEERYVELSPVELGEVELWDLENPVLYHVSMTISANGKKLDTYESRIGFRHIEAKVDGFYLNGEKIFLRGLNRHQSYPYVGYAMPKRVQEKDADILRYELGLKIVRTSHYPQSPHF